MKNVVEDRVVGAAVLDVERPAAVRLPDDRVVDHDIARGTAAAVDLVERDAAGVVVVEQIVLDARVLHAVHVDAAAAADAVVVDRVAAHERVGDDAVAALAEHRRSCGCRWRGC